MAVNFSGGIDVTESFVRGFSAIANVNMQRQRLNLEAAQMVQNYNLKQQELEQNAQFLPLEYKAKAATAAATLAYRNAQLSSISLKAQDMARQHNQLAELQGDIEGSGYEPGTPEFLDEFRASVVRNPYATSTPEYRGLIQSLKLKDPQNAQSYNDLLDIAPGQIQGGRITGSAGSVLWSANKSKTVDEAAQVTKEMKVFGLDPGAWDLPDNYVNDQGIVQVRRNEGGKMVSYGSPVSVKKMTDWKIRFQRAAESAPETQQTEAQPARTLDRERLKASARRAISQGHSVQAVIEKAAQGGVTFTPEELQ